MGLVAVADLLDELNYSNKVRIFFNYFEVFVSGEGLFHGWAVLTNQKDVVFLKITVNIFSVL